ncbi:MAG: I78 family peptidase inhibitor [Acidovorax sp.]|uniref:I78 family peptidase inhibitor n=1 Tax=Acidovorax sp. TaxID=1872122 RepID=UPI00391DC0F4
MIKTTFATAGSVAMAAVLMMTGCAGYGQAPASPPASSPGATAPAAPAALCNAQPAQAAVGQSSTASVMETARVRSGAQMARILRPGQMITKEFNAQRLNLEVDANGRILAVRCG